MNTRLLLFIGFIFAAALFSQGEPVPPGMLARLASENYVEREKTQDELLRWAREKSETRIRGLVKLLADEDPEIRKRTLEILRKLSDEDYLSDGQGYLGIMMAEEMLQAGIQGEPAVGIRISRVMKGSPADSSGLNAGDLIIALDGAGWEKQGALDAFMDRIAQSKPLADVVLTVRRDAAEPFDITVKLGKRPIPDLRLAQENPQDLDLQAKDEHFKQWLKGLTPDRN